MIFEIKHRWSGDLLFTIETTSWKLAVEAAIRSKANLSKANLSKADLSEANLSEADLSEANLSEANLSKADLSWANLSKADLSKANLSEANLSKADLSFIRDDLWAVLSSAPHEVEGLRQALVDGKVDGSTYTGDCACLVGTIANVAKCNYEGLPILKPNASRPAEKFFLTICPGQTPETHQPTRLVVEWIDQWLAGIKAAFGGVRP